MIAAAAERYGALGEELMARAHDLNARREALDCPANETTERGTMAQWRQDLSGLEELEASNKRRECVRHQNSLGDLMVGTGRLARMFAEDQMDELVTGMEQRLTELEPGQINAALETAETEHEAYANVFELASQG